MSAEADLLAAFVSMKTVDPATLVSQFMQVRSYMFPRIEGVTAV